MESYARRAKSAVKFIAPRLKAFPASTTELSPYPSSINLVAPALALVVLAGCGGADREESPVWESSPGSESGFAGTVRISAALSETGNFAVEGRDSRQGYDTWVRWWPNGSGKTTLFDCLSRVSNVDEGSITFDGTDITRPSPSPGSPAGYVPDLPGNPRLP